LRFGIGEVGSDDPGTESIFPQTPLLPQSFWRFAAVAQRPETERVVAFGKTKAGFVGHQGTVIKVWRLQGRARGKAEVDGPWTEADQRPGRLR